MQTHNDKQFAWVWWELALADFDPAECPELVVRAWDAGCNTQPSEHAAVWNYTGMMNNAVFRVKVVPTEGGNFEFQHPTTWMEGELGTPNSHP